MMAADCLPQRLASQDALLNKGTLPALAINDSVVGELLS